MQGQIINGKTIQGTKRYNMAGWQWELRQQVLRHLRGNFMISFSKEGNIATWATYSFRECKGEVLKRR